MLCSSNLTLSCFRLDGRLYNPDVGRDNASIDDDASSPPPATHPAATGLYSSIPSLAPPFWNFWRHFFFWWSKWWWQQPQIVTLFSELCTVKRGALIVVFYEMLYFGHTSCKCHHKSGIQGWSTESAPKPIQASHPNVATHQNIHFKVAYWIVTLLTTVVRHYLPIAPPH